jgi:hypothetical protein
MYITELFSKQQGDNIVVIWKYNPTYDDGRPLKNFKFIVYRDGDPINIIINKKGNMYWFLYPIDIFNREYCFFIEVKADDKVSEPSKNTCIITKLGFPPTPKLKNVKLLESGLELEWKGKGDITYIYRGDDTNIVPIPVKKIENNGKYLDTSLDFNKKYCYYVTTSYKNSPESNPSNVLCKEFVDIFPPKPPSNFKIIKKGDDYYLFWTESPSKDVIGYLIYKNGKPLFSIPIKTYYFIDKNYKKGDKYYIIAIDRAGNKSKKVYLEEVIE